MAAEGIEIGRVVITKTLTEDDVIVDIWTETNDDQSLPLIDALGMIELGKDTLLHPPEDDDE